MPGVPLKHVAVVRSPTTFGGELPLVVAGAADAKLLNAMTEGVRPPDSVTLKQQRPSLVVEEANKGHDDLSYYSRLMA